MPSARRLTRKNAVSNPRRTADLRVVALDDGYLVLRRGRTDRLHRLNASAALVLELADGNRSIADIVALVAKTYRMRTPPVADVRRVLKEMAGIGLVTSGSASPARSGSASPARSPRPSRPKTPARRTSRSRRPAR